MKQTLYALSLLALANADCYMHMPRGSNNRLNEKSANRNNGDRLFDSQNNNRGGYNKGDYNDDAADGNGNGASLFTDEYANGQYSEVIFEGSKQVVEWTAQHGCGGSEKSDTHKLNCNMVLQYMCNTKDAGEAGAQPDFFERVQLMDGRNTGTPGDTNNFGNIQNQNNNNDNDRRGRHEHEAWYYQCQNRARNKGLFTADQKLKGDTSKYTRQNPNGNRRGLECPEERDYYPYWHPTPWVDVAYMTDTPEDCTSGFNVLGNTMNTNDVYKCAKKASETNDGAIKNLLKALTQEECSAKGGEWTAYSHKTDAPACIPGEWSRVNHLGNGRDGNALTYNWTVPLVDKLGQYVQKKADGVAKCVLRIRYNISTDDYDPRLTNSSHNEDKNKGIVSPVEENPTVGIDAYNLQGLRLAINTAQFGRTFQDRSHTFYIRKRVGGTINSAATIRNLQVRGKRGNIVQTFPSVEYDFVPTDMHVAPGELIHVQWTGSNTHNNGNPAGDGQAGDAGEGTGGTDRHNIAPLINRATNYPIPVDAKPPAEKWGAVNSIFDADAFDCFVPAQTGSTNYNQGGFNQLSTQDCSVYLATGGHFKNVGAVNNNLNPTLNNAPASLHGGVFLKAKKAGQFHYMGTRNNNFSNRSQKGTIIVGAIPASAWGNPK